jgi:hypothetical protein
LPSSTHRPRPHRRLPHPGGPRLQRYERPACPLRPGAGVKWVTFVEDHVNSVIGRIGSRGHDYVLLTRSARAEDLAARWALASAAGSGTHWHVDPLNTSAWNTLLAGRKVRLVFSSAAEAVRCAKDVVTCSPADSAGRSSLPPSPRRPAPRASPSRAARCPTRPARARSTTLTRTTRATAAAPGAPWLPAVKSFVHHPVYFLRGSL